jgi:hypothetical protein
VTLPVVLRVSDVTGRIFISYRRSDDQSAAGRLFDRLLQHFDREQLLPRASRSSR